MVFGEPTPTPPKDLGHKTDFHFFVKWNVYYFVGFHARRLDIGKSNGRAHDILLEFYIK